MKTIATVFGFILYIITGIATVAYHLWTVLIYMQMWGWFGGIISFIFPGLSWMFLCGILIPENGFINTYTKSFLGIALLYGLSLLFMMYGTEERVKQA